MMRQKEMHGSRGRMGRAVVGCVVVGLLALSEALASPHDERARAAGLSEDEKEDLRALFLDSSLVYSGKLARRVAFANSTTYTFEPFELHKGHCYPNVYHLVSRKRRRARVTIWRHQEGELVDAEKGDDVVVFVERGSGTDRVVPAHAGVMRAIKHWAEHGAFTPEERKDALEELVERADCIVVGKVEVAVTVAYSSHFSVSGEVEVKSVLKGTTPEFYSFPRQHFSAEGIVFFRTGLSGRQGAGVYPGYGNQDLNVRPLKDLEAVKQLIDAHKKAEPPSKTAALPEVRLPPVQKADRLISLYRAAQVLKLLRDGQSPQDILERFDTKTFDFIRFEKIARIRRLSLGEAAALLLHGAFLVEQALLQSPSKGDFVECLKKKYGRDVSRMVVLDQRTGHTWVGPLSATLVTLTRSGRGIWGVPAWTVSVMLTDGKQRVIRPITFKHDTRHKTNGKLTLLGTLSEKSYQKVREAAIDAGGPNFKKFPLWWKPFAAGHN